MAYFIAVAATKLINWLFSEKEYNTVKVEKKRRSQNQNQYNINNVEQGVPISENFSCSETTTDSNRNITNYSRTIICQTHDDE